MATYPATDPSRDPRASGGERDSLLLDVTTDAFTSVGSSSSPSTRHRHDHDHDLAHAMPAGATAGRHSLVGSTSINGDHSSVDQRRQARGSAAAGRSAGRSGAGVMAVSGMFADDGSDNVRLVQHTFYRTLANTVAPPELPGGVIEAVVGDIAHHPFPPLPSSATGKIGMGLLKATGIGYAYYRAANTRVNPGEVTWLQDGSDQYVISRPGLYYFAGPTRTLHPPQRLDGQEAVELGNTKIVTVPPGRIGFCSFKNQVYVLSPGTQFVLSSPYISYLGSESLDRESIQQDSVSLIRIQAGQFAVVRDVDGHVVVVKDVCRLLLRSPEMLLGVFSTMEPRINVEGYERLRLLSGQVVFYLDAAGETQFLDSPGTYELRAPSTFVGNVHNINDDVLREGSVTIVRVQSGQLACMRTATGDVDELLGIHSVNEPRIEHGTFERVRLQAGKIIFYQSEDGETRFYDAPGTYTLRRPAFFDRDLYDVNTSILEFGSVVRLNLKQGEVSYKFTADGRTELLLQPGVHVIQRPEQFGGHIHRKWERHISLGAFDIVNIPPGFVAITYDGRTGGAKASEAAAASGAPHRSALRILHEGHHILDDELWTLSDIRSIQEKRLDLRCHVYSRNRVAFDVKAFVLYKVVDPKRAFVEVVDIEDELHREAEATLLAVFGAHDSNEISQGIADPTAHAGPGAGHRTSKAHTAPLASSAGSDDALPTYEQAESFADVVRSAFQLGIRDFAQERGVALTRMRVESIDFADANMKRAVEQQAEVSIQISAERLNVEQRNQTALLQAEGEAAAIQVQANADANAKRAATMAEVEKIRSVAAAQGEASENPLAVQLALIEAYAAGQARMFAALGNNVALLPTDLQISAGGLPGQIRSMLAADGAGGPGVASLFSVKNNSGGAE
ncbi:uncharacterized protein AMSG_10644 [Thecamonas trahens ATCC 50062]|uniref:Band 7 domain-containing protein n=1 Tax=Thecamonas trahens ATCC 50062 TaxID=461836 RepID=A0A0L0DU82_THETB|nr:hypothetical protein AMSG_10644 [Thecamonas trahens ATCC 50062]KNC55048.1 hypothetical protein AMSG_10644 [Thecamonas trahens ATCC 50062]|eukprot:XP_013753352.1 hypothetical protein AMSG_10644 [Thecamonas trahens ATCC 50062]